MIDIPAAMIIQTRDAVLAMAQHLERIANAQERQIEIAEQHLILLREAAEKF